MSYDDGHFATPTPIQNRDHRIARAADAFVDAVTQQRGAHAQADTWLELLRVLGRPLPTPDQMVTVHEVAR